MDEKQKELNEEQKAYLSSFKSAMESIDKKIKDASVRGSDIAPKAYKQLVREGYWSPDIIAFQFALCSRGMCSLSARLREYIIEVGKLAKQIFDKSQELKEKNENEDNTEHGKSPRGGNRGGSKKGKVQRTEQGAAE